MSFDLDHLFICTEFGAPAAEQLIQFGLTEGSANVHPGQGTANRREALQAGIDAGLVETQAGQHYLMELGFDGETGNQYQDFRPALPLVVHW